VAGELARVLGTAPIVRQGDREIAVVSKNTEVAMAKVIGIVDVAQTAMMGTGAMSMTKRQLETMAPEDAGKLDHLETIAVVSMGNILQRLSTA